MEREVLDLRGLRCPLPAIRTERQLAAMPAGETLAVLADDPLAPLDIAHGAVRLGCEVVSREAVPGGGWCFVIRRP